MLPFLWGLVGLAALCLSIFFLAYQLGRQSKASSALPGLSLTNVLLDHAEVLQSLFPGWKMLHTKLKYIVNVPEDEAHEFPVTVDFFIYNNGGGMSWGTLKDEPAVEEIFDETRVVLPPGRLLESLRITYLENVDALYLTLICGRPFGLGKLVQYTATVPVRRQNLLALPPPPPPEKERKILAYDPLFRSRKKGIVKTP